MPWTDRFGVRPLSLGDGEMLCGFYNGLSENSRRTFRPLGPQTNPAACEAICQANVAKTKYDLVAGDAQQIVGWCFVWNLDQAEPMFGLAVADALHGKGLGRYLTDRVLEHCDQCGVPRITLTVVIDNHVAKGLYQRSGFREYGQFRLADDGLDYYRMDRLCPKSAAAAPPP